MPQFLRLKSVCYICIRNSEKMKRFKYTYFKVLLAVLFMFTYNNVTAQSKSNYKLRTVVIDPGHGGKDSGTSRYNRKLRRRIKEKDLVLEIGLKLGKLISETFKDVKVIYTRKKDVYVPLSERNKIANDSSADLFISIHIDAIGLKPTKINGVSTWILGLHADKKNHEVAMRENAVVTLEEDYLNKYGDPRSPETYIMLDVLNNKNRNFSLKMAESVQKQMGTHTSFKNHGVRQAGFMVLWGATMPSVLVELGFINNPKDFNYLIKKRNRNKMAIAIFEAFVDYKSLVEGKKRRITKKTEKKKTVLKKDKKNVRRNKNSAKYMVQFFTSYKKMKKSQFRTKDEILEMKIGKLYKYYIGKESSIKKIKIIHKKVVKRYPDAFIVKLNNPKYSILR